MRVFSLGIDVFLEERLQRQAAGGGRGWSGRSAAKLGEKAVGFIGQGRRRTGNLMAVLVKPGSIVTQGRG